MPSRATASHVARLAQAALGIHDPRRIFMAHCNVYIDGSGSQADPATEGLSLAGYVATEEDWIAFEDAWSTALARESVPTFSMKHFAHSSGCFRDWESDQLRRDNFLKQLIDITKRHVRQGFSMSVRFADYDKVNSEYEMRERFGGPYAVCAGAFVGRARVWMRTNHPADTMLFIFEHGDAGQHEMVHLLNIDREHQTPLIQKKMWNEGGNTHYLRPFETADLYAYEVRKAIRRGRDQMPRGSSRYLEETIPINNGLLRLDALRHNCHIERVSQRRA